VIVAAVAVIVLMHLFIPLIVPVLLICGVVYLCKQVGKSFA
jgi:hypothetical protein